MLQPELKPRRDKIRVLMAQQDIDAALIACNVNLIYTYGRIVNGYIYMPLHTTCTPVYKRPNNIKGNMFIYSQTRTNPIYIKRNWLRTFLTK